MSNLPQETLRLAQPVRALGYAAARPAPRTHEQAVVGVLSVCLACAGLAASLLAGSIEVGHFKDARRAAGAIPQVVALNAGSDSARAAAAAAAARALLAPLSAEQTEAFIDLVDGRTVASLSPPQREALRQELQRSGQHLADPTIPLDLPAGGPAFPREDVSATPFGGQIYLTTLRRYGPDEREQTTVRLDRKGSIAYVGTSWVPPDDGAGAAAASMPHAAASDYASFLRTKEVAAAAALGMSAVNGGLAVVLLLLGLSTLRADPQWAGRHRAYAWAKIAVALVTAAVTVWMLRGESYPPELGAEAAVPVALALLACAYPAFLLRYAGRVEPVAAPRPGAGPGGAVDLWAAGSVSGRRRPYR